MKSVKCNISLHICAALLCSVVLVLAGLASPVLQAQGFDWQYDARMPSAYPDLFLGVDIAAGASNYSGELQHKESYLDPLDGSELCRECGIFESGDDQYLRFGLRGEYWLDGFWVLRLGASFVRTSMNAEVPMPDSPTLAFGMVSSELQFESSQNRAQVDLGARYRVFDKFSVGAGLNAGYLLSESFEQRQQIIAPAEAFYEVDGANLTARQVEGEFSSAAELLMAADFGLFYDLPLARGLYATTSMAVSLPINSSAADQTWNAVGLRLGVSVLYGQP